MRRIFALIGFAFVACYSIGEGIAPPLGSIYFPTGLALSQDSNFLYVANSDFDLQYNAGTLLSLDLNRIRSLVPRGCASDSNCPVEKYCDAPGSSTDTPEHSYWCVDRDPASKFFGMPCGALGERSSSDRVTVPGRCQAADLQNPQDGGSSLVTDAVAIGAFATDIIARDFPNSDKYSNRLFIPVRGESSVNWVDATADGKFDCGQGAGQLCDQRHRAGQDPSDNSRGLRMPPEPYAIAATPDASAIIVTHQTQGAVSLLVNDWTTGPHLNYVLTGLPPMPIAAAAVPEPLVVQLGLYQTSPGFLIAYETTPRIDLLRFSPDSESTPARPYLELSATATVTANSGGYDVRGLAVDDAERRQCEANATATDAAQLMTCANIPLDIYASSRSPASLLIGHTTPNTALTPNSDIPYFNDTFPLPTGPSAVHVAQIINEENQLETRVFIVSFDSRRIAIFDPAKRNIEAWVITGRGPQALAFDVLAPSGVAATDGHAYAYVGHFTDSYLGVVELDRRRGRSYGTIVLSLGPATAPRASK